MSVDAHPFQPWSSTDDREMYSTKRRRHTEDLLVPPIRRSCVDMKLTHMPASHEVLKLHHPKPLDALRDEHLLFPMPFDVLNYKL